MARTVEITSRYPTGHGAPVHVGDPAALGIADLTPDFGPAPVVEPGTVPMFWAWFWACGVTPQLVLPGCGAEYVITRYAGHMFVFDHHVNADPLATVSCPAPGRGVSDKPRDPGSSRAAFGAGAKSE